MTHPQAIFGENTPLTGERAETLWHAGHGRATATPQASLNLRAFHATGIHDCAALSRCDIACRTEKRASPDDMTFIVTKLYSELTKGGLGPDMSPGGRA